VNLNLRTHLGEVASARTAVPAPRVAVGLAREARSEGRPADAVRHLTAALRHGHWGHPPLWYDLLAMMQRPSDYHLIRSLWWESARGTHDDVRVMRTVARAASLAGRHGEARSLVRRAAVLSASEIAHSLRNRMVEYLRRTIRPPGPQGEWGDERFAGRAQAALADLNASLDALGIRWFLIAGTLLGSIRDGGIIPWDKDVDIGVFDEDIDHRSLERSLTRAGTFSVRTVDLTTDRLRLRHVDGVQIDIFPHYTGSDSRLWHDGAATRWWNTPFDLRRLEILGIACLIPDPPEPYLEESYGAWQVPDRLFDARIDAPNVEVTDPDLLLTLHFFSLLSAQLAGDRERVARYAGLLRDAGEGDWLDRL
jgi:hypothetical protein